MIRRSFRIGLTLGLLGGLAFALVKMLGARPAPEVTTRPGRDEPWPRLAADPAVPAAADVVLVPDPAAPSPVAPVAAEAVIEPSVIEPVIRPATAKKAPAKKPAAKKAPAKKGPAEKVPAKGVPAKKSAAKKPVKAWVDPAGGVCPTSHPVKAKLASKIFHLPGMLNYERTQPDRCYLDAAKAEADGLRAAKR